MLSHGVTELVDALDGDEIAHEPRVVGEHAVYFVINVDTIGASCDSVGS